GLRCALGSTCQCSAFACSGSSGNDYYFCTAAVAQSCSTDQDCSSLRCVMGTCTEEGPCSTTNDCLQTHVCVAGMCVQYADATCASDTDCHEGFTHCELEVGRCALNP